MYTLRAAGGHKKVRALLGMELLNRSSDSSRAGCKQLPPNRCAE